MRAYVSIRGSRSPRRVDRDASEFPGCIMDPYASLTIDTSGGPTSHELSYVVRRCQRCDGEGGDCAFCGWAGENVFIVLTRRSPKGTTEVYRQELYNPSI